MGSGAPGPAAAIRRVLPTKWRAVLRRSPVRAWRRSRVAAVRMGAVHRARKFGAGKGPVDLCPVTVLPDTSKAAAMRNGNLKMRVSCLVVAVVTVTSGCWNSKEATPGKSSSAPAANPSDTTAGRITPAESSGRISGPTALLYRVYAVYGDDALPPEYRAPRLGLAGTEVMRDIDERYATLPSDVAAAIAPYRTPPGYEGSWHERRRVRAA